jgi:ferredoxin
MRANYGYKDGSGEFFITIDSNLCNSCEDCVTACPAGVLEMITDDYDDVVAAVTEEHRKKIKYSCAECKPIDSRPQLPCVAVCEPGAIEHSW